MRKFLIILGLFFSLSASAQIKDSCICASNHIRSLVSNTGQSFHGQAGVYIDSIAIWIRRVDTGDTGVVYITIKNATGVFGESSKAGIIVYDSSDALPIALLTESYDWHMVRFSTPYKMEDQDYCWEASATLASPAMGANIDPPPPDTNPCHVGNMYIPDQAYAYIDCLFIMYGSEAPTPPASSGGQVIPINSD